MKIQHTFRRTDGKVADIIQGPGDRVVKNALVAVWRDMFLAQLARRENEDNSCSFVKDMLPPMLDEICSLPNISVHGLFSMIDNDGGRGLLVLGR